MIGSGFQNIFKIPELRRRVLITLALLIVYRLGVQVPVPGIDRIALASFFANTKGTLLGMFDMFSGGALENLSIFALGIMPYISASIILQLLTVVFPYLAQLKKEGEQGRKKITQYTRYGTVVLSIIQGFAIAAGLQSMTGQNGMPIVMNPGMSFILMTVITMTAGTAFLMWLGEQITERGIGNGISLIIFTGIVCRMPAAVLNTYRMVSTGEMSAFLLVGLVIFMVVVIGCIIFIETAQRRITVNYAKRVVGRKMYGGQSSHLPLKINTAGVIPPIFASSLIMFPATIVSFADVSWLQAVANLMRPGNMLYEVIFVALIFFFCFFYTAVQFNPEDVADNMKKSGGFIPGIRPGSKTAEYIDKVLTRLTLGGAIYISIVCVIPSLLMSRLNVPFYFGGTSLLIIVGVGIDTISQMETHMLTRNYEGFMKKGQGRIPGRR